MELQSPEKRKVSESALSGQLQKVPRESQENRQQLELWGKGKS